LALCCAFALLALPGSAFAGGQTFSSDGSGPAPQPGLLDPNGISAGDQYVETVPTARGPRAAAGKGRGKLPRAVVHGLRRHGAGDASTLESVATSPAYGAPAPRHSGHRAGGGARRTHGHRAGRTAPAVPSAAIGAVGRGNAGLGWLVLAILAITAFALAAVGFQRHRNRPPAA